MAWDGLAAFIVRFRLEGVAYKRLKTALQYGLYYGDVKSTEASDHFFLQRLAECSPHSLHKVLDRLSLQETVNLINYLFQNYREGSWVIIGMLKKRFSTSHPIQKLIKGLRSYYYDETVLEEMELSQLIAKLEAHAQQESDDCYLLFRRLVALMIDSPLRMTQTLGNPENLATAEQRRKELQQRFAPVPTQDEFSGFTRRFGLTHHLPLITKGEAHLVTTLRQKLEFLCGLFDDPVSIFHYTPEEILDFFSLVWNIILHNEAMHHKPEKYIEGLHRMTCALPTKGRRLATQPCLPSLLDGLRSIGPLDDLSVIVYDQSEPTLFTANQRYLQTLSKRYRCPILHLSVEPILALAKKLQIEALLNTSKTGILGYGGARNCVFLLTPVLRSAFDLGHRTLPQILNLPSKQLQTLFQEHVLGGKSSPGDTILMCDDDMEIPASNLFGHALFAHEAAGRYSSSPGLSIGRLTKFSIRFQPLKPLLKSPEVHFGSTEWSQEICSAAMSECVTKPKICLNLPFGSEEAHQKGLKERNPLLHPSLHLAGTRYPTKSFPTRPWMGLEEHLASYIPYSLRIALTLDLLDPTDQYKRCVFPWNQNNRHRNFASLRDVFAFISSSESRQEVQYAFWKNVELFRHSSSCDMPLRQAILDLIRTDVEAIFEELYPSLSRTENASLKKICRIYQFFQRDALLLWEYCEAVLKGDSVDGAKENLEQRYELRFVDFPLTEGLYLLFHAVGLGEFNEMLGHF